MPLSFNNTVANSTPSLSNALKKKIKPEPLEYSPLSFAVTQPVPKTVATAPKVAPAPQAKSSFIPTAQASTVSNTTVAPRPAASPAPTYIPPMIQQAQQKAQEKTQKQTIKKEEKAAAEDEVPTFSGILFDLIKHATKGTKAVDKARKDLTTFQQGTSDKIAAIRSEPIPLEFQQGRAQAVQQASAEKEKALQTGVENALTAQGQTLGALNNAAGLATPQQLGSGNVYIDPISGKPITAGPTQVPYSNQYLNPLTGQPVGGGAAGGTLQSAVTSIAEKVQNGSMSYDAGVDALGGFGQAGVNELTKALGPNFNVQQSNAQAAAQGASTLQTGTLGGQLQKGAETVKAHMATLADSYKNIGAQYGYPILNRGINAIAEQFGNGPLQSYNIALSNVRDELAKILGGGTSTDGTRATAKELLPDNMTPDQLAASIKTANELMDSKIAEYTRTPSFNNNSDTGGGGSGSIWDF